MENKFEKLTPEKAEEIKRLIFEAELECYKSIKKQEEAEAKRRKKVSYFELSKNITAERYANATNMPDFLRVAWNRFFAVAFVIGMIELFVFPIISISLYGIVNVIEKAIKFCFSLL